MKVVLNDGNIHLIDKNRALSIIFAGTGDLHWIIRNNNCNEDKEYSYDYFEITKENYQIYSIFEKLLYDIKNINIFEKEVETPSHIKKEEEKNYKKYNMSHYNDFYNDETETVTWVSDETGFEVANIVSIKKFDDKFLIEFKSQPYIEGYERESNILGMMGIRFRNSGSRYAPFNIIFMRMFRELQQIDDINDYGHQIHIEEYLYQKNKIKKYNSTLD